MAGPKTTQGQNNSDDGEAISEAEHYAWFQDDWCRDEPARLNLALLYISRLSRAATAGGSVIELPPCAEYNPKHPPDNFSEQRNRLFIWLEITKGVLFARPNDEFAPLQRFSESILTKARFTAPMVNSDMLEVLRPERGDSSSLFLYDVYVVAASAADRFDCQTGTIQPVAPPMASRVEKDDSGKNIVPKDSSKAEKALKYIREKYPNDWPAKSIKGVVIELNGAGIMVHDRTVSTVKSMYQKGK